MGEIIALRQMSGGEYDAARAVIGNRNDAKPKWDQELCKLFTASGWATEALARREGIHVRTMQQRLLFGRFLTIAASRGSWLVNLPGPNRTTFPNLLARDCQDRQ